jgi:hypothetical protein
MAVTAAKSYNPLALPKYIVPESCRFTGSSDLLPLYHFKSPCGIEKCQRFDVALCIQVGDGYPGYEPCQFHFQKRN